MVVLRRAFYLVLLVTFGSHSCKKQDSGAEPKPEPRDPVAAEAASARPPGPADASLVRDARPASDGEAPRPSLGDAQQQLRDLVAGADRIVAYSSEELVLLATRDTRGDKSWSVAAGEPPPGDVQTKPLSKRDTRALLRILSDPESYRASEAACHNPHLAVAFYGAAKQPDTIITICIECANVYSSPQLAGIGASVAEYGDPGDEPATGFGAFDELRSWCKKSGIKHCDQKPYWERQE